MDNSISNTSPTTSSSQTCTVLANYEESLLQTCKQRIVTRSSRKTTTWRLKHQSNQANKKLTRKTKKLIYETFNGRTNLARAAATNAQNHIIADTQVATLAIPDTMVDTDA
ncbi:unnamed protein product [Adineta ricciae]|uniref:Uncharacterized protein n=1 Tax=Adineta ricciae TaxID=249248 RepID=A0A814E4N8_ADIRI|nr:unnamed protein product [Adineta ricciae]CAF0961331.1 unnamed protein product [Adineta ricciae]